MSKPAFSASTMQIGGLPPPVLDTRTPDDIYAACLAAARIRLPDWAVSFGQDSMFFDRADPGLVMFKLFGELFHKLNTPLNGVPGKYAMAFWDFMGVTLRPPEAAEAPIAFAVGGKTAVTVPALAQVISTKTPGLVFQTLEALKVLPISIAAAYGVQPDADAYTDATAQLGGTNGTFTPFGAQPSQQTFIHALHISDPGFDFSGLSGALTISMEGANLYPQYFGAWTNAAGFTLKPELTVSGYDTVSFTFADFPDLPTGVVDGMTGAWLSTAPAPGMRIVGFQAGVLPEIYSLVMTVALDGVAADAAMFNASPVDLKKGGQPFGQTPALQDAFYIASETVFARTQAQVTLNFQVQTVNEPMPVTLAWEYWDGGGWAALGVEDGTADLTRSGKVAFLCPQIVKTSVNNKSNYWIRARIAAGGYGAPPGVIVTESAKDIVDGVLAPYVSDSSGATAALAREGINFGYAYQPSTYAPPFVLALQISCVSVKRPDMVLAQNGFQFETLGRAPYRPAPETRPTFYLGLASEAYDTEVAGQPLSLFCTPDPASPYSGGLFGVQLALDYLNGETWKPLMPIERDSRSSRDGIALFLAPADFPPQTLFGQSLRWLRVEAPARPAVLDFSLAGICLNVAPAENAISRVNVILGSSTGEPDQVIAFPQKPILAGPVVQVLEPMPAVFSSDDADLAAAVEGGASLAQMYGASDLTQAWVTWKEVSNFDFSTPASRHYILDHTTGELAFGDGVRGQVPPQGKRNIRAAAYRSGGGTAGNVGAGVLDALQTAIPGIARVQNLMGAVGGMAADAPSDLIGRAPGEVMSQGAAVTLADFADAAIASSQDVAQAVCEDLDSGAIRLTILAGDRGQAIAPGFDLTSRVADYVKARALPLLAPRLEIVGPDYVGIDAAITVALQPGASLPAVTQAMDDAYAAFLDPFTGGPDGTGWNFGDRVGAAAVAVMAAGVSGVDFVDGVSLGADLTAVDLAVNQLPTPGVVSLVVLDAHMV